MKRVLCIVSSLDTGGAETFMMKIFRSLPQEYKLDFVVSTNSGYYEDEVKLLGGIIYRVPLRTKHPFKTLSLIYRIVRDCKYEYVLKLCDTPMGVFDLMAAKLAGAEHICVRSCNASSSETKIKHIIYALLRPGFNALSNVKLAPSELAAEYTFGKKCLKSSSIHILHNAVDLNVYRFSENARRIIRKEFNIEDNTIVIGHIGRLNRQKNHIFLLEVFAEICKKNTDSLLLLVGDGELKDEIYQRVKQLKLTDRVVFAGIRSDVPQILSAMDVFIFPSLYEGMPNTIIEAQATGLPCVLSDTITKEARITELIHYLRLDEAPSLWAEKALEIMVKERVNTQDAFKRSGYDIDYSVNCFIEWIFGDAICRGNY